MTKRQPKGTSVGGQFAPDRKPQGSDLAVDYPTQTQLRCFECGTEMTIDDSGASYHVDDNGEIDHDLDGEHVAFPDEDEVSECINSEVEYLGDISDEQPYTEEYCNYCDSEGHTFRTCPRRDDSTDVDVSDDFPMSLEYDTSYEDGDYS